MALFHCRRISVCFGFRKNLPKNICQKCGMSMRSVDERDLQQPSTSSATRNKYDVDGEKKGEDACQECRPRQCSPDVCKLFSRVVMKELRMCQWYWGAVSARMACRLLRGRPIGTFLVRDSHSENSIFSVSYVTSIGIFHSRLARHFGHFCMGGPNSLIQSTSMNTFINQTLESSLSILMHNTTLDSMAQPVSMRHPLRRADFLPSLRYYCRLTIMHALADAGGRVDQLPLPRKAQRFLKSAKYLMPC